MGNIPLVSFNDELKLLKKNYSKVFNNQLSKGEFIGGKAVDSFESKIREYFSIDNAVSVGNGTDALVIGLESVKNKFKITKGKVIVPAFSFFASSEAIVQAGFEPLFIDVEKSTGNMDTKQIYNILSSDVVGILPVHLYGKSCEMEILNKIKVENELFIVEDVAQAFGAKFKNQLVGTIGDIGCFSFFPSKILGGFGDGGMIITNDIEISEFAKMLKNHGSKTKYENELVGYNSRLDSLQAAMLSEKLDLVDGFIESRKKIGSYYIELLKENEYITLMDYEDSVFNYFTIQVNEKRDELASHLKSKNISTAIYYPKTLPSLKAHKNIKQNNKFPNAEYLSKTALSLPIWSMMEKDIAERVVQEIDNFYK